MNLRFLWAISIFCFCASLILNPVASIEKEPEENPKIKILQGLRNKPLTVGQGLDIADTIFNECSKHNIDPMLIVAIISVESEFKPWAISRTSARGLMQISPEVWKIYMGETPFKDHRHAHDQVLNITVGAQYLADLYQMYGDWPSVLRHYFCGSPRQTLISERYVQKVLKKYKEVSNGKRNIG